MNSIHEYNSLKGDFVNYCDNVSKGFNRYISDQRKPYDDFFRSLNQFYLFKSFLVDSNKITPDQASMPMMSLYSKAALSLLGVITCLQSGLISEAAIILRSILENLITVKVMLESEPHDRIELYHNFESVIKRNHFEDTKRLLKDGKLREDQFRSSFSDEMQKEILDNYELVKHNYHPKLPYHWAWKLYKDELRGRNPTIKFLADKFQLHNEYHWIYASTSVSVHVAPSIKNIMIYDGAISLAPNFSQLIFPVGIKALEYCSDIVKDIVTYINPSAAKAILNYVDNYLTDIVLDVKYDHYPENSKDTA